MKKRITTIEDLAIQINKNSISLEKHLNKRIEDLVIMFDKGFTQVGERFDKLETIFDKVEKSLDTLVENTKVLHRDVLDIGDRFVRRNEFDNLLIRFDKLEKEIRTKK